jgi:ABC-2 type transport system permease protein
MFERIKNIIIKEFIQALRDPKMRIVLFVIPVVQMLVFGNASSMDVEDIPTAIYDLDNTQESRELIRQFSYSKYFNIKQYIQDESEVNYLIDRATVSTVIRFNHGFGEDIKKGKTANVQVILDGTDSNTASIIMNYATSIIQRYNKKMLDGKAAILAGEYIKIPSVDLRMRALFNSNLNSKNFFLPSIIALILLIVTLVLTSMAIVKEKEIGTIEQLLVSPIRPIELILGKLIPFAIIGMIEVFLVVLVTVYGFGIPVKGSILLLFFCSCLYLLNTLGIGLLISTMVSTQQEAIMSTFFFAFPCVLLSGFVFPIYNMPEIAQYVTYLNPLRYFIIIVRGIFLKGVGVNVLWPHMLALFIIGMSILGMSSLKFKKTIG